MPTPELRVEATRGTLVESLHRVAAAVVDAEGGLIASSGDPDLVTWWRSAAKPFQALPVVQDGAADRFQMTDAELALACASHSSEPRHLDIVSGFMSRAGISDQDLACGPHTPLSPAVAALAARGSVNLTPRWSNCSGKHAAMIALARHHGWPSPGYQAAGHPVQERILSEVVRWTGVAPEHIAQAPDGCTAVCFGLPLRAMALSYARLASSREPAARRIVSAMTSEPFLVAGTGRLCTDLMTAWNRKLVAKIGAEGIYSAALVERGIGIALKVEDGDMRASGVALLEVLVQVLQRLGATEDLTRPAGEGLRRHARPPIQNSRGTVTGELRPAGALRFSDDEGGEPVPARTARG